MCMDVTLRTLTPLWTGGVDRTMDRIHETSILGSLRWWYEAIVRGLGGSACDPSTHTCPDNDGNYCDVCAVFGATGLQRAFRLEGPEWWNNRRQDRLTVKVNNNRGWYLGHGYIGEGAFRIVPLRVPAGLTWDDVKQTLLLTLRLIEGWGGLGPKTQVGYGVVQIELDAATTIAAFEKLKQRNNRRMVSQNPQWPALDGFFFAKVRFKINANTTPKQWIKERVTNNIELNEELDWYLNGAGDTQRKAVLPLAPIVRYHLRTLIRNNIQYNGRPNAPARWHLMGVISGLWHQQDFGKIVEKWQCPECNHQWDHFPKKEEHENCKGTPKKVSLCLNCPKKWKPKQAVKAPSTRHISRKGSLIHVSHAYPVNDDGQDGQWEFRIWGWIPETLPGNVSRNKVLNYLRRWLGVQQQRHRHQPQNGALWSALNMTPTQVCWFERQEQEQEKEVADYLKALLKGCEETSHGGTENTGR
ncbi:MAG: type III-B CRISPR module RAMP protein Cmr1 [Ardenticatenia bacterium]|nr:MAG: type III-B CRISPR module RAMP protein Cmr1 [Ardenticatenia bacterium]